MIIMTSLIDIIKNKLYAIREGLQLTESVDDLIKKLPVAELEQDYYYDFVKDALVPKSTVGVQINEQTNQLISLLNLANVNKFEGVSGIIELPDNTPITEVKANLPIFNRLVNTIILDVEFSDYTGYDDMRLYYYLYTPTEITSTRVCEVMEDWILRDRTKRAVQITRFIPQKDVQLSFVNSGSRALKVKYTLLFSEVQFDNEYNYAGILNNETLGYSVMNPVSKFNRVAICLNSASTLNFDIDISINFGRDFYGGFKIHDITVSSGTTYYYTFEIPAVCNPVIYLKNNGSVDTEFNVQLFFSNYSEPDLSIDDLNDVSISSPADNEVLAYNSATTEFINQTASEAGLAVSGHNHSGVYQPASAYIPYFVQGSYTGDGATSKAITIGVSAQVVFVMIWRYYSADNDNQCVWSKTSGDGYYFATGITDGNSDWWRDNRIKTLGVGYFTIGDDGGNYNPNASGQVYHYFCLCIP